MHRALEIMEAHIRDSSFLVSCSSLRGISNAVSTARVRESTEDASAPVIAQQRMAGGRWPGIWMIAFSLKTIGMLDDIVLR